MKINMKLLLGVLFLFGLLFRPPILPIDLLLPLTAISLYGILRELLYKKIDFKKFYLSGTISVLARRSVLVAIISLVGFTVGITTISDYSFASAIGSTTKMMWTFVLLPINLTFFFMMCQKHKIQVNAILRMILYATMLQVFLVLASYAIPPVKDVFIAIMQANNWSDRWTELNIVNNRMFGFAKALFDTFGYGMGILATVPFILTYRTGHLKYLTTLPFIFLTILINARTGLVVFGIVTILFSLLYIRSYGRVFLSNKSNILSAGMLTVGIIISLFSISSFTESSTGFSERTMNDINSYIAYLTTGGEGVGSYGGQADVLFSERFWTLPDNAAQLVLGTGLSVYGKESPFEFSTDVGYVNNIWYIGLFGSLIFYILVISYVLKVSRKSQYWRVFAVASLFSLFIFQIKGNAFWSANLGISATLLLVAVCVYSQKISSHNELVSEQKKVVANESL